MTLVLLILTQQEMGKASKIMGGWGCVSRFVALVLDFVVGVLRKKHDLSSTLCVSLEKANQGSTVPLFITAIVILWINLWRLLWKVIVSISKNTSMKNKVLYGGSTVPLFITAIVILWMNLWSLLWEVIVSISKNTHMKNTSMKNRGIVWTMEYYSLIMNNVFKTKANSKPVLYLGHESISLTGWPIPVKTGWHYIHVYIYHGALWNIVDTYYHSKKDATMILKILLTTWRLKCHWIYLKHATIMMNIPYYL